MLPSREETIHKKMGINKVLLHFLECHFCLTDEVNGEK